MKKILLPIALCCAHVLTPALAAPMDAFLSANQSTTVGEVQIETAYDLVNNTVDVLHLRASDANYAGTNVGDYHGAHVRAGVAVTPTLWIDGAFWNRNINYHSDVEKIKTWQLAAQYKLLEASGYRPAIALRLGAWGNYSNQTVKSTPTTFGGETLDTLTVASPKDRQLQLDLIGTSTIFEHTELSSFVGAGLSQVSLSGVSGTATLNGCKYNVAVSATDTVGTLATPCNASLVINQFSVPNSSFGIDVNKDAKYNASYVQGGLMLKWNSQDWQVRTGYQYQALRRKNIDEAIASKGQKSYQSNHILLGEISYHLIEEASIFVRGQYMTNQFVGELPFAYNTFTASRFDKRYGLLSMGLNVTF